MTTHTGSAECSVCKNHREIRVDYGMCVICGPCYYECFAGEFQFDEVVGSLVKVAYEAGKNSMYSEVMDS